MTKSSKPSILVLSTSLDPNSRSALLAKEAHSLLLKNKDITLDYIDLRDFSVPLHNGHEQSAYAYEHLKEIHDRILQAQGVLLAAPIYNYSVGACCKNIIELTGHPYKEHFSGKAWMHKVVAFVGACGSPRSLMAPMTILNSLFLDFKAMIVPSFVLASLEEFQGGEVPAPFVQRLENLTTDLVSVAGALQEISWKA